MASISEHSASSTLPGRPSSKLFLSGLTSVVAIDALHVKGILALAGLEEPDRLPSLEVPSLAPHPDSAVYDANCRLVNERTNSPGYVPPERQKRNKLRFTKKQKEAAHKQILWTFTKAKIARALSVALSETAPPPPVVTQALLARAHGTPLEELWHHLHDPKLEESMKKWYRPSRAPTQEPLSWLNQVITSPDANSDPFHLEYLRILCHAKPGQQALDSALGLALSQAMNTVSEILLSFGAKASMHRDIIASRIGQYDDVLARLLLSAPPAAMSVDAWRHCLTSQIDTPGRRAGILLICLSHRPDIVDQGLFLRALEAQHLVAANIILAFYTPATADTSDFRSRACELASLVEDNAQRFEFFTLLNQGKLLADCHALRLELHKNVVARSFPLVLLLVDIGVVSDGLPTANAVQHAVSIMDMEMIECLARGSLASTAPTILSYAPEAATELAAMRLVEILAPRGLQGSQTDELLVRAACKGQVKLARVLVNNGTSVNYENGAAFYQAAQSCHLEMLNILYEGQPTNQVISEAVSGAWAAVIQNVYSSVLLTISLLLQWGASGPPLHQTLLAATSEDRQLDVVRLMVKNGADANYKDGAAFSTALTSRNLTLLEILCTNSPPSRETIKAVLPNALEPGTYEPGALDTLLGSSQDTVTDILRASWSSGKLRSNPNIDTILPCFLRYGLDVDHDDGDIVCFGVRRTNISLLDQILSLKPNIQSLTKAFDTALEIPTEAGRLRREIGRAHV